MAFSIIPRNTLNLRVLLITMKLVYDDLIYVCLEHRYNEGIYFLLFFYSVNIYTA